MNDERTPRGYPLPHPNNLLSDDVHRLREAITSIDAAIAAETAARQAAIAAIDTKMTAFGFGGAAAAVPGNNIDDNTIPTGFYYVVSETSGTKPPGDDGYGHLIVSREGGGITVHQLYLDNTSSRIWTRVWAPSQWSGWVEIYHSGNISSANAGTATKLQTARTLTIGNTGKSFDGSTDVSWSLDEIGTIPSGTRMLFVQTAAPTGWTKDTTHNDKALRVVSGTASSGGTRSFSSTFEAAERVTSSVTATGTVGSTTLTTTQIPSHKHSIITEYGVSGHPSFIPGDNGTYMQVAGSAAGTQIPVSYPITNSGGGDSHNHSLTMNAHSHTIDLALAYVDVIIATKD